MIPTILLVDDRTENLFALQQTLARLDVQTVTAATGNDALRATLVHDFALAILDVQMPGMDGYELAALLRGDRKTQSIPIIFLTAVYSEPGHIFHGYQAGAVDFITKPFTPEILLAKVSVFLELYTQRSTLQTLLRQQNAANEQLEAEIKRRIELENYLQSAKAEAEAANKSKSVFLASTSHEVRNPLNGVLGMLQLLGTTELDKEQRQYMRSCTDAAKSLLRVINDILDISRIEAGKFDLAPEDVTLWELVESVLSTFRTPTAQIGVTLDADLEFPKNTRVRVDAGCLRQILYNLLGNALKFTTQGAIRILGKLVPHAYVGKSMLRMCVEDTGCGIPLHMQPLVFDLFTQAHTGAEHRSKGAGLGLGIVQRLVELMEGRVILCSEEGRGATVCFDILVEEAQPVVVLAPPLATEAAPGAACASSSRQLSVLLVEDEEVSRLAASSMLKKMGHRVLRAANGQEALDLLQDNDFDVILMDVSMPVLDGLEATRILRSSPELGPKSRVPIIAMTAHAMKGDRERMLEAGMDDYISKPIDMEDLRNLLCRVAALRV